MTVPPPTVPDVEGRLCDVARLFAHGLLRARFRRARRPGETREDSLELSREPSAHALEPQSQTGEPA